MSAHAAGRKSAALKPLELRGFAERFDLRPSLCFNAVSHTPHASGMTRQKA